MLKHMSSGAKSGVDVIGPCEMKRLDLVAQQCSHKEAVAQLAIKLEATLHEIKAGKH